MLDECKGEKLEEVLAAFSSAVLKRKLEEQAPNAASIAEQVALETLSYSGERTVISTLLLAYKASLRKHLYHKNDLKASYGEFSELLALNERKIERRRALLEHLIQDESSELGPDFWARFKSIHEQLKKNWSGSDEWLEFLLYSDSRTLNEGFLGAAFETAWAHFQDNNFADIEGFRYSLPQQLDERIRSQEDRLTRWQGFVRRLAKPGTSSPTKQEKGTSWPSEIISLTFSKHLGLQIGLPPSPEKTRSTWIGFEDYKRVMESLTTKLAAVRNPPRRNSPPRETFPPNGSQVSSKDALLVDEEGWLSVSDMEEPNDQIVETATHTMETAKPAPIYPPARMMTSCDPYAGKYVTGETRVGPKTMFARIKEVSDSPDPAEVTMRESSPQPSHLEPSSKDETSMSILTGDFQAGVNLKEREEGVGWMSEFPAKLQPRLIPPVISPSSQSAESESEIILNSVKVASPSPKKSRHTLSLAERTRLSMSRASHSKFSALHDDVDDLASLTQLTIRPKAALFRVPVEAEEERHADLIERTRPKHGGF